MRYLTLTAKAVRTSLMTVATTAVVFSGSGFAAEGNTAEESAKVERIEVTGSRIKQVDMKPFHP